jgi:uncharacterized membrane protein YoaK (UPF0700 family)
LNGYWRCSRSKSEPPAISLNRHKLPARQKRVANAKNLKRTYASIFEAIANQPKGKHMLWTIFVILLVLYVLGLVSSYTMGGFIHLLLVIAVVVLIINLISGRRV